MTSRQTLFYSPEARRASVIAFLSIIATAFMPSISSAQVVATLTGDVRVAGELDEPNGGLVGDENGGFTNLVVGINTGLVQNWSLLGFNTSDGAGQVATGAELTINVATGFGGGANHGTVDNTFSIHSLYAGNAGWVEGGQGIQNSAANVANDGVVTFIQQAFGNTTAGTNWVDAAGVDVPDFRGAFDSTTPVNSNTVNGWVSGSAPDTITLEITDAAIAQDWLDNGFADLVLQVNDPDGMDTSRFNLINGSPALTIFTVPEPSSAVLIIAGLGLTGAFLRRRR